MRWLLLLERNNEKTSTTEVGIFYFVIVISTGYVWYVDFPHVTSNWPNPAVFGTVRIKNVFYLFGILRTSSLKTMSPSVMIQEM